MRFQRLLQFSCATVLLAAPTVAQHQDVSEVHRKALEALRQQSPVRVDPEQRLRSRIAQDAQEPRGLLQPQYNTQGTATPSAASIQAEERMRTLRSQPGLQRQIGVPTTGSTAMSPDEVHRRALEALRNQSSTDHRAIETRANRLSRTVTRSTSPQDSNSASATANVGSTRSDAQTPDAARREQDLVQRAERLAREGQINASVDVDAAGLPDVEEVHRKALHALRQQQTTTSGTMTDNSGNRATRATVTTPARATVTTGATTTTQPATTVTDPNRPMNRREKLTQLLEEYRADKMTPEEYQQRRAKIIAETPQ